MKKIMMKIYPILLSMFLIISSFCGCQTSVYDNLIENGDFGYYYIKEEDCYAVLDLTEQGNTKEVLYIPYQFQGKEVKYTNVQTSAPFAMCCGSDRLRAFNAKKIYLPYIHKINKNLDTHDFYEPMSLNFNIQPELYLINTDRGYLIDTYCYTHSNYYFITASGYAKILNRILQIGWTAQEIAGYKIETYTRISGVVKFRSMIQIANTSYIFNYENAPNEGYFFINDFERGGLIENTPYEPIREEYIFDGWYKEPECINEWNFEEDRLPETLYNENNEEVYQETKLYAKWIKNS